MPHTIKRTQKQRILSIIACFYILLQPTYGRDRQDYAENSILAEGNWVKISTTDAGIYQITEDSLRAWGFTDLSKIKLFGYGGTVIDELFANSDNYIDDLPQIPLWRHNNKLYFYSQGTTKWSFDSASQEFVHRLHPYSTYACYFLTDRNIESTDFPTISSSLPTEIDTPITVFDDYALHEKELISVGKTGQNFFGEDFLSNSNQDFTFHLSGAQPSPIKIRVSFGAKISGSEGYIHISYNGTELPTNTSNKITKYYDSHEFLRVASPLKTVNRAEEESTISLRYASTGTTLSAYLDYIRLNYKRKLQLYNGQVCFRFINRQTDNYYRIENSTATTLVWDITTPHRPKNITTSFDNNTTSFTPEDAQLREFIAFDPEQNFPSPSFVRQIENQNLHALNIPELTIITPAALQTEAERVAQLHREEGLTVAVIEQEKIFNEFSSGTPDASAYRRLMKMFYDRAEGNENVRPRYLLLFGDGSYNNRKSMEKLHSPECNMLLTYQSKTSIDERESFVIEDYFGFLEDNSGEEIKVDKVCLGIGRFPISSIKNARLVVDKLYRYVHDKDFSSWKNNICIAADDGDEAIHAEQADRGSDTLLLKNTSQPRLGFRVNKIYIDSYYMDPQTKKYPEANRELMKQFNEGMLVFNYIGHNDPEVGFTGEGLFSRYEMEHLTNTRLPLFITITCDYCQFDAEDVSAGENVFLNPSAGAIALITTTRVVYTDGNDKINQRLMKRLLERDSNGSPLRIGDVLKLAKRDFNTEIDKNKLNYVLIGDPALKLAYPEHSIQVTRINGNSGEKNIEMIPGKNYTVEGEIRSHQNELLSDFNGYIYYNLYDKEKQFTTLAHQDKKTWTYTHRPDLLTTGKGTIQNGIFRITVALPIDNSHSGKSGLLNLYAYDESGREANGYTDKLIVSTTVEPITEDIQGPDIEFAGINDDSFTEGILVNNPATFVCKFSDPSGIWSGNSLGKQMTLSLDGACIEENVARYYKPIAESEIPEGEFIYPLPRLSNGLHTLTFKVFDTLGNSSEVTIAFEVKENSETYTISLEEEPATERATISCQDQNGNDVTESKHTRISVTNTLGEEIWSYETTENNPFPLTWNLQDNNGKRVSAGQYYCKGYFETSAGTIVTPAKKIVVITQ